MRSLRPSFEAKSDAEMMFNFEGQGRVSKEVCARSSVG